VVEVTIIKNSKHSCDFCKNKMKAFVKLNPNDKFTWRLCKNCLSTFIAIETLIFGKKIIYEQKK